MGVVCALVEQRLRRKVTYSQWRVRRVYLHIFVPSIRWVTETAAVQDTEGCWTPSQHSIAWNCMAETKASERRHYWIEVDTVFPEDQNDVSRTCSLDSIAASSTNGWTGHGEILSLVTARLRERWPGKSDSAVLRAFNLNLIFCSHAEIIHTSSGVTSVSSFYNAQPVALKNPLALPGLCSKFSFGMEQTCLSLSHLRSRGQSGGTS